MMFKCDFVSFYILLITGFSYLSLNSSHVGSHFDDKNISDDHLMDMYYMPVYFVLFPLWVPSMYIFYW